MAKVALIKELIVKVQNKVGMMAEVADAISKGGSNITALNAFGIDDNAIFRIITSDNAKALKELKSRKMDASEKEAVQVELENKVGTAALMARKLKDANIDIKYIYATTCNCTCECECTPSMVFNSSDNKKAVEVLNK